MATSRLDPAESRTGTTKDRSIQSLRGLAVLLMVAGHVIGSEASRGMNVEDNSIWRFAYLALEDIRMPLFTVISGYVYAMRPLTGVSSLPHLVKGKSRRLLVPLFTVGFFLFILQYMTPGTNSQVAFEDLPRYFVFTSEYGHLWFLQSIFLIFLTVGFLDAIGALRTPSRLLAVTAVASLAFVVTAVPGGANAFGISGYIWLLPFFLIGYALNTIDITKYRLTPIILGALAFSAVYAVRLMTIAGPLSVNSTMDRTLSLSVGVTAVLLLYMLRGSIESKPLAWVGAFSFGVYLLHVFGSAASRIALHHIGIDSKMAVFAVGVISGVFLPIAFELLFGRWRIIRLGILGEKPKPVSR